MKKQKVAKNKPDPIRKSTNESTVKEGKTYLDALVGESGGSKGTPVNDKDAEKDAPTEKRKNTASYLKKGFVTAAELLENPLPVDVTKTSVASPQHRKQKKMPTLKMRWRNLLLKQRTTNVFFPTKKQQQASETCSCKQRCT